LNKVVLIVTYLFIAGWANAQTAYQQFTLGGGPGAATAYAGAALPKTEAAFYIDAGFYPIADGFINLQGQSGTLAGDAEPGSINHKSFQNSYKSVTLNAQLFLGVFYKEGNNGFLNFIRKFYGGSGYGVIINNITNVSVAAARTKEVVTNRLDIIPVTGGYEFNVLRNAYNEPMLKINISSTFYYVPAKGLDGYSDVNAAPYSYYTYYAIGLKYIFIVHTRPHRDYNRLD
jgi:hypothetical protein